MSRKKPSEQLVNVAVMAALRHSLTYRVPDGLDVRTGRRVLVPLGNRKALGIVLEPVARMAPGVKARDVLRVVDPEPLLSPELLTLGLWIAEYYLAPVGEVFRAMLPLRAQTGRVRLLQLTARGRKKLDELETSLIEDAREGSEARLLRFLAQHQSTHHSQSSQAGVPLESARRKFPDSFPELIASARAEGWVTTLEIERERGQRRVLGVRLADSAPAVQGPMPE